MSQAAKTALHAAACPPCPACICTLGDNGVTKDHTVVLKSHTFWMEVNAFIHVLFFVLLLGGIGLLVVNGPALLQGGRDVIAQLTGGVSDAVGGPIGALGSAITSFGEGITADVASATSAVNVAATAISQLEANLSSDIGSVMDGMTAAEAAVGSFSAAVPTLLEGIGSDAAVLQSAVNQLSLVLGSGS